MPLKRTCSQLEEWGMYHGNHSSFLLVGSSWNHGVALYSYIALEIENIEICHDTVVANAIGRRMHIPAVAK